jgi:hypothetical protein
MDKMNSIWEAIKMAFSGFFNLGTVGGLFAGIVIYVFVCGVTIYCEDKELFMRLLAELQLRLGVSKNRWAKHIATWLWARIINLDYARRCELAMQASSEEEQFWHLLQLPNLSYGKKSILRACRMVAGKVGISDRVAKAAQVCVDKMEHSQ